MLLLSSLLIAQFVPRALGAIGPNSNLYVANKDIAPDGFTRSGVLVGTNANNLAFPGPVIRANKNDHYNLNVIDELTDPTMLRTTSIHWHGFFMNGTAWADGPAGVTQCPIAPGHSFRYKFQAKNQAGTFWYHSHHLSQYCDGLRGVMVVYDRHDPHRHLYDVDNEQTIITLADWYHTPAPSAGLVPTPDSTLINGKGRYVGGPMVPLSVIHVRRGRRYRFRLVSLSCDPFYTFSIDGHSMTIIEADGISTEPLIVDSIQIFAGQRYSFVLNANRPVDNYWVRANPNLGDIGYAGGINSAILRYVGAPNAEPTTTESPSLNPLLETNLHPLHSPAAPGNPTPGDVDVAINLDVVFDFASLKFQVNGATFDEPPLPVMLQIMSGAHTPQDLLPAGGVYTLPKNAVVELSMPGGSVGSPHPMHLHGHAFSVVRSAGSSTYNFVNPVQRDVVSIGQAGDNVTIRFRTDNSGPWILHCHIDWHLVLGLSVVFAEDVPTIAASNPPPAWHDLCPIYEELPPGTR
ncbi:laccase 3 [Coprinopsis cinerea okayama7|uniref:Laccase 14 n=1 Tax=Coprinopsis cinerea (strain Okayama-7 / 130 / ATCC MYA-4618 / FGSC 9003) TaxID=240176 RepID=Q08AB3_COPC7|nr:laccase 3 [Coprinopsis cinerea okayama7\|eukprot:XP_001832187.1 laccase 3 [Coprinopsis cinerea okayama7\